MKRLKSSKKERPRRSFFMLRRSAPVPPQRGGAQRRGSPSRVGELAGTPQADQTERGSRGGTAFLAAAAGRKTMDVWTKDERREPSAAAEMKVPPVADKPPVPAAADKISPEGRSFGPRRAGSPRPSSFVPRRSWLAPPQGESWMGRHRRPRLRGASLLGSSA